MAAKQRLQVLVHDVAGEDEARVAEHQAEQPDDPACTWIVGDVDDEAGEIDLGLDPRRRLEAHLTWLGSVLRADRGEMALHRRVGPDIAEFTDLPGQPSGAEVGKGGHALAHEVHKGRKLAWPARRAWSVGRRLDAALDVFAHGLGVAPGATGDGGDRYTLPVQFEDHQLFKSDHRRLPCPRENGRR